MNKIKAIIIDDEEHASARPLTMKNMLQHA